MDTKYGFLLFFIISNTLCLGQTFQDFVNKFPTKNYPLVFDTSVSTFVKQNKKLSKDEVTNILIPSYSKNRGIDTIGLFEYLIAFPNRFFDHSEFTQLIKSGKQIDGSFDFIPLCKVTSQKTPKLYLIEVSFFTEGYSYQILSIELLNKQITKVLPVINSYSSLFPYFKYQYCKLNLDSNIIVSYSSDTSYYIVQRKQKADSTLVIINQVFQDENSLEMVYLDYSFDGPKIYYTSKKSQSVIPLTILAFNELSYKVAFPNDKVVYELKPLKNKNYSYTITCTGSNGSKQVFTATSPKIAKNEELSILTDRFNNLRGLYNYINFEIN